LLLIDVAAHLVRSSSSSFAKNTQADFKISFRPPQLEVLRSQPPDLLALLARRQVRPLAGVGFVLADALAQRLGVHPEIGRDVRDRPLALQGETDAALHQFVGVLLRSRHENGRISFRQDVMRTIACLMAQHRRAHAAPTPRRFGLSGSPLLFVEGDRPLS
jgi:hypothetical protein